MSADRLQGDTLADRDLSRSLDGQHAHRPPARHQRRGERTARAAAGACIADEHRLAGGEHARDERAIGHPCSAGDREPLTVAGDQGDLVHAQTIRQRRAQPSQ